MNIGSVLCFFFCVILISMMYFYRKSTIAKCFIFVLIHVIVYYFTERFIYINHNWNELKCTSECTRILLVADPQLIGLRNEEVPILTPITIWDSDNYLSKTYNVAYDFVRPNVVIFLGDLFDEGSIATHEEYLSYKDRFFDIFSISKHNIKYIFISGDNDIGGEGSESVSVDKVKKFSTTFPQPDIVKYKNLSFYKINRILQSIPKVNNDFAFEQIDNVRIGISHMPLIFQPSLFVDKVFNKLQPHLIFTAHEHKSMIVVMDGIVQSDRQIIPMVENKVYNNVLGISDVCEIIVPTCSYRMGTTLIGYGYIIIENGEFKYTVLWSPSRFHLLSIYIVYLFILFLVIFYFCIRCCMRKCFNRAKSKMRYSMMLSNNSSL